MPKASESRNFSPNGLGKSKDQALEKETRQATVMKFGCYLMETSVQHLNNAL